MKLVKRTEFGVIDGEIEISAPTESGRGRLVQKQRKLGSKELEVVREMEIRRASQYTQIVTQAKEQGFTEEL